MNITPEKLETGEKMALLDPGGIHDIEIFLLGTNTKIPPGSMVNNQLYTDQFNKGNFKICMSGSEASYSPTVCSTTLPTEKANTIGISYSQGSYTVNYDGGSISGAGGFTGGQGKTNKTSIGEFDNSTKKKIQKNI